MATPPHAPHSTRAGPAGPSAPSPKAGEGTPRTCCLARGERVNASLAAQGGLPRRAGRRSEGSCAFCLGAIFGRRRRRAAGNGIHEAQNQLSMLGPCQPQVPRIQRYFTWLPPGHSRQGARAPSPGAARGKESRAHGDRRTASNEKAQPLHFCFGETGRPHITNDLWRSRGPERALGGRDR